MATYSANDSRTVSLNSMRYTSTGGQTTLVLVVLVASTLLPIGITSPITGGDTKCETFGNTGDPAYCITKGCIETAIDIRRSMNLSVNPCDNFYEFSCGRYLAEAYGATTQYEEQQIKFNKLIEGKVNRTSNSDDHEVIKYAQEVYQNCMTSRTDIRQSSVARFIRDTLNVPKWPTRPMSNLNENYIYEKAVDMILQFNLAPLFDVDLVQEKFQVTPMLRISAPRFQLPHKLRTDRRPYSNYFGTFGRRPYSTYFGGLGRRPFSSLGTLESDAVFNSYVGNVSSVMREFGAKYHPALSALELKQMAEKVVRFEQDLFVTASKHKSKTAFETLTVQEIDRIARNHQSTISLRTALDHLLRKSGGLPLQVNDKIQIFNSAVLTEMMNLISNTKQEILVNYFGYRLAVQLVPTSSHLTSLFPLDPFPFTVTGFEFPLGSRDKCLLFTKQIFLPAFTRYPDPVPDEQISVFGLDLAQNIGALFSEIKNELILNLPKNTRLSDSNRKTAEESIKNVRLCQENWIFNQSQLEKYYAGIYPFKTPYLEQMVSLGSWRNGKTFSLYGKVLSDTCDNIDILSASFFQEGLQMSIPQTLWMEPFYNQEWPEYLKYSGVADTIGHEMMHALMFAIPEWVDNPNPDPNKAKNTKNDERLNFGLKELIIQTSNVNPTSGFYSQRVTPTFRNSQCMVNHYENFSLNKVKYTYDIYSGILPSLSSDNSKPKINGTKTFEENFADIGGIQLAFKAYKSALEKNVGMVVEKALPGLTDFSNEQVFFLNYARKWCDRQHPIIREALLKIDNHSPAEFRVLGTLRNNEDFARAWNCPAGSFMNPIEKCPVF